jgi:hypothetical protein
MLNLENVTIVSINTRDSDKSIKAIEYSSRYIKFGDSFLLSDKEHSNIKTKIIPKIKSLGEYSLFCVKELYNYINTSHVLIVQPDGFVTNPLMWTDDFLNFDYIGAPWDILLSQRGMYTCNMGIDIRKTPIIVGNGGFSLRSKKILEEASKLDYPDPDYVPEDNFFCILKRKEFKELGIKYADVKTAKRFSFECPIDLNEKNITIDSHFGFHGGHGYKQELLDLLENNNDILPIQIAKKLFNKNEN